MTVTLLPLQISEAMRIIWERRNGVSRNIATRLVMKIATLTEEKNALVRTIGSNPELAQDIGKSVTNIKAEIKAAEETLASNSIADEEFNNFANFSLEYVDDLNVNGWALTPIDAKSANSLHFPEEYL